MQMWKRCSPAGRATVLALLSWLLPTVAAGADPDPYYEYRDESERGEFQYDDSQDIPWIENETEVLALPRPDDLSRLELADLPPGMELLVDRSRISVHPNDRVVRIWLWLRSRHGAENGSFEGYRCSSREYKVYAYANPRRTPPVTKAKRPVWRSAKQRRPGNYRAELMHDYLCGIRGVRSAEEIRQAMTGHFEREYFLSN